MYPSHQSRRRAARVRLAAVLVAAATMLTSVVLTSPAAAATPASVSIGSLTTNGRVDPLGIPGDDPVFGWTLASELRAQTQSAYEIQVGRTPGASDVWATGRVESAAQADIAYGGPALEPGTAYHWRVRVWDGAGNATDWSSASFETGLLAPADWGSAEWIGRSAAYSGWTDYTASVDFSLNAVAFGTFLRAKSASNAYMWQINVGTSGSSVPSLVPHRLVNGGYTVLPSVDLRPFGFTRDGLLTGTHTIAFEVAGTTITTTLDGVLVDTRAVTDHAFGGVGIRTYGSESVTVRGLSVTATGGAVLAQPDFAAGNPLSAGTHADGAVTVTGGSDALLLTAESNAPLFRKEFTVDPAKTVASARVYAAAHGIYELALNGDKVGDQHLAPGYTEYAKRIQSQTYDVTDQIVPGANVIGASLGDGWWAGKVGLAGRGQYGTDLALVARLKVAYTDGTTEWIDTDASWTWAPGPFVATDLQIGETYDARAEKPGWNTAGYSGAGWSPVRILASDTAKLSPQPDEPVRETQVLDTVNVTTPAAGLTVYDLGQNMVGVSRLTLTGTAGQTVKIRHAEVLNPNGTLYTENLRAALATDYYTFAQDGTVTYQPTFTQHGFRYIEVSGLTPAPAAGDVKGVVWGSDLARTGTLETSHAMLNQLISNITWGARGNFLSIPTDTPARDERLGWTGDINVFSPTASYLFDMRAFLGKWMTDVRDEQKADGQIPAVVPSTNGAFDASGPGWQDAIVAVPYALYRAYDDTNVVRTNWASMLKFYDFAKGRIGDDNLGAYASTFFTTTDWLSLESTSGIANEAKSTAIWADTARMMAEMADAIGDPRAQEFADRFEQIKRDFVAAYVAADGTVAGNTQTGYALALGMGLVDDEALRAKVGDKYVAKLALSGNHLATGFIGTPWLLPALSAIGRDDLAYEMLLKEDYPSWGYEISKGATTVWERWNSIQPDGSFGPVDMNSFNHYAYGAVADWMHRYIGGIRIGEPGYRTSVIEPRPGGGITEAAGRIETIYGPLSTDWSTTATGIRLDVTVPVNTTSTVRLPAGEPSTITEGGAPLAGVAGITAVRQAGEGVVEVVVGSGSYSFEVTDPITITGVTVEQTSAGVDTLVVAATNNSHLAVQGQASAIVPDGWGTVPSALAALAPGASGSYRVRVTHPLDAPAGDYTVPVTFADDGRAVASTSAKITVAEITLPPTEVTSDHVDFGNLASEAAHSVAASPTSGISTEAGFTRRYSHNNTPGSWFSAEVAVEPGQPFLLRMRETWNSAGTKDYDVLVDGTLVRHVRMVRTAGGQGTTGHQILVTDPEVLDNDGTVTVTFQYPVTNAALQYYDPSIADLWVIPVADEASEVAVAVTATTRCVAGKVVVAVSVTNGEQSPVDASAVSAYGSKTFAGLAPGKTSSAAFSTRQAGVVDGTVEVSVVADGGTTTTSAGYAATTCG
ncbi:MAG TPA: family 78 glycoside hydrolase catalytic domain [Arachnia sp.]|nr:family 78 glycoside hydrolase catalytic domain [Arachnia sp.]HMT86931.1 family 78 glycoside hydrolase catalytic domain [Arachnia sp.]